MLISLLNSVILLVAVGVIVAESVGRMLHPAPVEGGAIAWTAGVGVVINGFTAWLFMKDKDKDLNVKGAYLHMAADALVSVGVLVSGVVISWTGWTIVDPIVGLVVAALGAGDQRQSHDQSQDQRKNFFHVFVFLLLMCGVRLKAVCNMPCA